MSDCSTNAFRAKKPRAGVPREESAKRLTIVPDNYKITIKDLMQLESLVRDMWECLSIYTNLSAQMKELENEEK